MAHAPFDLRVLPDSGVVACAFIGSSSWKSAWLIILCPIPVQQFPMLWQSLTHRRSKVMNPRDREAFLIGRWTFVDRGTFSPIQMLSRNRMQQFRQLTEVHLLADIPTDRMTD